MNPIQQLHLDAFTAWNQGGFKPAEWFLKVARQTCLDHHFPEPGGDGIWDADKSWAGLRDAFGRLSTGERHVCRWLYALWTGGEHFPDRAAPPFDLFQALGTLDSRHRAQIAAHLLHPWWP